MNIVHLVHNYPPEFRGGTEIYLEALCREQRRAGHEVQVVTGSEVREWRDDLVAGTQEGIPVHRFHRLPQGEEYGADFYLERFESIFIDFLQQVRPDLVHLHHWMNLGNELLRIAASVGIPSLLTLHDLYPLCPRFFMIRDDGTPCGPEPCPMEDCLSCTIDDCGHPDLSDLEGEFRIRRDSFIAEFAAAGRVVVPSRVHAKPFIAAGLLEPEGFRVLHHGLVRPVSGPVWRPSEEGRLRVGTWGHLARAKGVHVLLSAIRSAGGGLEDRVEVHLFGEAVDPDYAEQLETLARGIEVIFHGEFSHLPLEDIGRCLDLAVFPSLARESYSMVLDEAAALGLPVVVSDAGAFPERVGEGGMVVPAGDAAALADAIDDLERDRSRLSTMSEAIRTLAVTVEDNAKALDALYDEVLEEGPRKVPARSQLRRLALLRGRSEMLLHERRERDGGVLAFERFRDFVPLMPFEEIPRGAALILAPHPDDEVIGCGGVTALHARRGDEVCVVHLTDGAGGGTASEDGEGLVRTRVREAEAAGAVLGTHRFVQLGLPDGALLPDPPAVDAVRDLVDRIAPSVVYAPSPFEIHPDHIAALFIAMRLLESPGRFFRLLLYEVNEAMVPGFLVDVSPVRDIKDEALSRFESQIRLNDVREKSIAGARWRTANVDLAEVTHAEAFIEAGRHDLRGLIARARELVKYIGKGGAERHD